MIKLNNQKGDSDTVAIVGGLLLIAGILFFYYIVIQVGAYFGHPYATSMLKEAKEKKEALKSDSKVTWNDFNQNFSELEADVNKTLLILKEKSSN